MLSITKVNNSIKVEGLDNKQFPDNGTLMIPLNSVILTLDESNIATFRSAANNDVLFSGVITDIQIDGTPMTKQTITTAFTNVANSSGGGGGTVDAYTKAETDALLATKANESELSDYATVESLATVATSGDYDDLSNKPTIPTVPTNVSAFNNDAGYLTQHQDISGLATKSELAEVEAEIPSLDGYATEQWVENQNYLTEHQSLDNYYTKAQTDTAISTATNDMATETWVEQQGYLTQHQDISGLATKTELSDHTGNTTIHVTALDKTNWNAKAELSDIPDVTGYIDGAVYDSQTKRINFKHGDTVVAYIDATPFVVDGMVDTVEITGGNLVITWNTDAGKQSTSIPLTDIFNPDNYYNKTDTDTLLAAKVNSADLAAVATSGDYDDLDNKPTIPTVPTNVSAFTNDAGYTTNEGTITGITMNGVSKGTSGVVDLGTVITEHQSLAGYVQTADLAAVATSGSYTDLTDKPNLFSGDYNDLTNKPTIPTVPTNVSAFTNDAGYTTNTGTITGITMNGTSKGTSGVVDLGTVITDISGKQDVIDASHKLDADLVDDTTSTNKFVTASDKSIWNGKQDELVSGTSIKTINNESILGSGNITIQGGGSSYTAGDNIDITNDVISVDIDDEKKTIASALTELHNDKADKNQLNNYQLKGDYQTGAQVDAKIATATSGFRTETEAINVEKVDAAALTDLNARVTDLEQGGGGSGITGITMNGSAVTVTSGVANLGTVVTDKSDKQDTLVSGTNIKTINNESILGSGNITIQGGGSSYTAGTNMEIVSSGGTDTINCTLPITAGTNGGVIIGDNECSSTGLYSISFGHNADNSGAYSLCMGSNASNTGSTSLVVGNVYSDGSYSLIVGSRSSPASNPYSKIHTCVIGFNLNSDNKYQANFGEYNISNHASDTFGDAGNTLLSIGNGYDYQSTHNRHNAFEIRQNGDIYIPDTDDTTDTSSTGYSTKPMLRLQDYIATIRSLVTRVTALETALGNISSSLDTINGEVI